MSQKEPRINLKEDEYISEDPPYTQEDETGTELDDTEEENNCVFRDGVPEPIEINIRDLAHRLWSDDSEIDFPAILVASPRRSGKSWFIKHLLYWMDEYPKGKYDACFLYSGSSFNNQWSCFPKRFQFFDWTEKNAAHLQSILRNQKRLIEEDENKDQPTGKTPTVFVLLDDIMTGEGNLWQGLRGRVLQQCYTMGRHCKVCVITIVQRLRAFSALRGNSDALILFRETNRNIRKAIIEEHMSCEESTEIGVFRRAETFYERCFKSKHHALVLDLAGSRGAKSLIQYCYSCKAPEEECPEFYLSPEHHWRQDPKTA